MSVTTLDPKTALIVIDLQNGLVQMPTVHPMDEIIKNAAALAEAFRRRGLPVVLVNVDAVPPGRTEQVSNVAGMPADWTEIVPALNRQPEDHIVTKQNWGGVHKHRPGTVSQKQKRHAGRAGRRRHQPRRRIHSTPRP